MTSDAQFNKDRRRLVDSLESLPPEMASRIVCLLALGAVAVLRRDYAQWPAVEDIVFNATMLLFCADRLANDDLAEMINYGIQIDDLKNFTDDSIRFARITEDMAVRALRLFSGRD